MLFVTNFLGNLMTLSLGSGIGWFSPTLPLLLSNGLGSGALTAEQISWIGISLNRYCMLGIVVC